MGQSETMGQWFKGTEGQWDKVTKGTMCVVYSLTCKGKRDNGTKGLWDKGIKGQRDYGTNFVQNVVQIYRGHNLFLNFQVHLETKVQIFKVLEFNLFFKLHLLEKILA